MSAPLNRRRLRVLFDTRRFTPPVDKETNDKIVLWRNGSLQLEFAVGFGDDRLHSLDGIVSVRIVLKALADGNPPAPGTDVDGFAARTIAAGDLNGALTLEDWEADNDQHGIAVFANSELNQTPGDYWLVATAKHENGALIPIGAGRIEIKAGSIDDHGEPDDPAPAEDSHVLLSEADGRYLRAAKDGRYNKRGATALAEGQSTHVISFQSEFGAAPTHVSADLEIPAEGPTVAVKGIHSITATGFTLVTTAAVPDAAHVAHWEARADVPGEPETPEDLAFVAWLQAVETLALNTVAIDVATAAFQQVTLQDGERNFTFTGFDTIYRSVHVRVVFSSGVIPSFAGVDWQTEEPTVADNQSFEFVLRSPDIGTTKLGYLVGSEASA